MSDDTWTPARIDELRALWNQTPRLSSLAIARRMAMTKSAVLGKAHRLQLPARPSPIIRDAEHPRRLAAKASKPRGDGTPPALAPAAPPKPAAPVAVRSPRAVVPLRRALPPVRGTLSPHKACQFIPGEPAGAETVFCCAPVRPGSSYCAEHHAVCWIIPPRREAA